MKHAYTTHQFTEKSQELIETVNGVLDDFHAQGYTMTLRQVYYQLVKANVISNSDLAYKRLGDLVTEARRAGEIDWSRMEDRTRNLRSTQTWQSARSMSRSFAGWYHYPSWDDQDVRLEAWIEKDALLGVLERPCLDWRVPYFACRGYVSDIEMFEAADRALYGERRGQRTVLLHLGDHDPSGIDMTRDIEARFAFFGCHNLEVRRLALNIDQVRAFNPPPNPAKLTDSRGAGYIDRFGPHSWELDALTPTTISSLVANAIADYRDEDRWRESQEKEAEQKRLLRLLSERFPEALEAIE